MRILHLSDIHFRDEEVRGTDDPNRALRSDMIEDVKLMKSKLGAPDVIVLSGDIAFKGAWTEYTFALKWLETTLCPAAGSRMEALFTCAGNHDVDRKTGDGAFISLIRKELREVDPNKVDEILRRYLHDTAAGPILFGPIEHYNRFAARFHCQIAPHAAGTTFAKRALQMNDGSKLNLWGFNSAFICNIEDATENVVIDPSAAQIEHEDGAEHVVISHHPPNWLRNGRAFNDRIENVAKLHLFGHQHARRVDENKHFIRIYAGALQPERDAPEWEPGYNWIELEIDGAGKSRKLVGKVHMRRWQQNPQKFTSIEDREGNPFFAFSFPLKEWYPPVEKAQVTVVATTNPDQKTTAAASGAGELDIFTVTLKLFKLTVDQQLLLFERFDLSEPSDSTLKDYELVVHAVDRAEKAGKLKQLNEAAEQLVARRA